jgi:hypothetical protein
MGCTGVPKAGDEDGIGLSGTSEGFSGRLAVAMLLGNVIEATQNALYRV